MIFGEWSSPRGRSRSTETPAPGRGMWGPHRYKLVLISEHRKISRCCEILVGSGLSHPNRRISEQIWRLAYGFSVSIYLRFEQQDLWVHVNTPGIRTSGSKGSSCSETISQSKSLEADRADRVDFWMNHGSLITSISLLPTFQFFWVSLCATILLDQREFES